MKNTLLYMALCFAVLFGLTAHSEAGPIYPGENACQVSLPSHVQWSEQEIWAWEKKICLGKVVDMSMFNDADDGVKCNPRNIDDWPETRELGSNFLKTIMAYEPYKSSLTGNGVQIQCAIFPQVVDFQNMSFDKPLRLGRSFFKYNVDLRNFRSTSYVSLRSSVVDGYFLGQSMNIDGRLDLGRRSWFREVNMRYANIGGDIDFAQGEVNGRLNALGVKVGGSFDMSRRGRFNNITLRYAKIDRNLRLSHSTIFGLLHGDGLDVAETVFMRRGQYNNVRMVRSHIGGQLQIRESAFDGHLNLSNAHIESEFQLATPFGDEYSNKQKKGEFEPPKWGPKARLTLRNAYAGALNDTASSWDLKPGQLDLIGFHYDRLGGLRATMDSTMATRSDEWMTDWLAKQKDYDTVINPQPFKQLASVLRKQGFPDKADAVMFAAQNYVRDHQETDWIDRAKLTILWATIGYGYHSSVALIWFVVLTVMGIIIYAHAKKDISVFGKRSFWYSFDMALPLIELEKNHEEVSQKTWHSSYFYFHKIIGFILVSFLVAGLSGLTK